MEHLDALPLTAVLCLQAEEAAQQQKLIKAAQTTPRGQRKDVSGEMAKGYMPLAVEAAWWAVQPLHLRPAA